MNTAVIIVTYNRIAFLKECIQCVLNQVNECLELYVINNASTDGTKDYLEELQDKQDRVHVLHLKSNEGGAGGFSAGLKYAYENSSCDNYLLIDDDAMLRPDYLLNIDKNRDRNKYLAFSGSVYVDNKVDTSHRFTFNNGQIEKNEYYKESFMCDIATFCGLLVTKELVERIKFPRSDFFIWNDDTEYCYRISKYSKIQNITSAVLDHKTIMTKGLSKNVRDSWKEYYGMRNSLVILKNNHLRKKLISKSVKMIGKAAELYILAILDKKNRSNYKYNARLRIDAFVDGTHEHMGKNSKYLP
ncbi:glycosyltransferase [Hungatella effluvii]|uniref:glycosyltransferase n=1 Tax=Hungatella effluvii TaxID=1096246 RepID=UPI0022DF7532|nr:glycosyltransferase [Hungatella effluvii]